MAEPEKDADVDPVEEKDNQPPGKPDDEPAERGEDTSRRGILKGLVVVGSAAYGGALAIPGYCFLSPDEGAKKDATWVRVAPLESVEENKPLRVKIVGEQRDAFTASRGTLGSVWIVRKGKEISALSAECPHLGCAIGLGSKAESFACPCHTSRFALDGAAESGPSPRGMDALKARVAKGWVEVQFVRFRQGVSDTVVVG